MQVGSHVYEIRMPFELQIAPGKMLGRFVNLWVICAEKIHLVDSGVAGAAEVISCKMREMGFDAKEITDIICTHGHPDHIGGAAGIKKLTGCNIAAHEYELPWIEDIKLQYQQRPVPGFHSIIEGPIKVDRLLQDGDNIFLEDGNTLKVIHTPGHSKGHVALSYMAEGILFCGDSIPVCGEMPIYDDVIDLVRSIKKLRGLSGLELLLSSWDIPHRGHQIYEIMDEGILYIQKIHAAVREIKKELDTIDSPTLAREVIRKIGLPETSLNPLFFRSIESHLRVIDYPDVTAL